MILSWYGHTDVIKEKLVISERKKDNFLKDRFNIFVLEWIRLYLFKDRLNMFLCIGELFEVWILIKLETCMYEKSLIKGALKVCKTEKERMNFKNLHILLKYIFSWMP